MIAMIVSALVVSLLVWFFVWKHRYIKRLKNFRDNIDFTTPEGAWLINQYNKKINTLNGYNLWRKWN